MKSSARETIVEILLRFGFVDDGCVSETTMRIGSAAVGYAPIHYPARVRLALKSTSWKVTVGAQTTCFYVMKDGRATSFNNFVTKNIDDIIDFVKTLIG